MSLTFLEEDVCLSSIHSIEEKFHTVDEVCDRLHKVRLATEGECYMKAIAQGVEAVPALSSRKGKRMAERAALEAVAFRLIARHHAVRMELGRTFIRIKSTLRRGGWRSYFAKTFAGYGIRLSTAQRWMNLARASSTNDTVALFKVAMDPQAIKIRNATALAQTQAAQRSKTKIPLR
jgi:hypothetical protein